MGPELLQRKLPLRVPTVALLSSDFSLSKSYKGEKLMQGKIIFTMHMELGPCNAITFLVTL